MSGHWRMLAAVAAMVAAGAGAARAEVIRVGAGGSLQAALDAARPGDTILLAAGREFVGNFTLPVKGGGDPITIRSDAADDRLPGPGQRVTPAHAPLLARIRSANAAQALRTAPGTRGWRLQYLEFRANLDGFGDIIALGDGSRSQNTLAEVPQDIVLSHVYVHGDRWEGQKRCIALNAANVTIRDSHISDCKTVGQDAQAIGGWNGPGPYVIENNYIEGAGENVLFGGSDPAIPYLVATGITFRYNHVARPMAWREPIFATPTGGTASAVTGGTLPPGTYSYRVVARGHVGQGTTGRSTASAEIVAALPAGGAAYLRWNAVPGATEYRVYGRTPGAHVRAWTVRTPEFVDTGTSGASESVPTSAGTIWQVKNLFELKNARQVVIERNLFENHWKEAQAGYAIVFTPRNSGGTCGWCVVEDVSFSYNVVRNVAAGINLLGYDVPSTPSQQTRRVRIRHNLFYGVSSALGGNGWFLMIGDEPTDVVVDHNTVSHSGSAFVYAYGGSSTSPRPITAATITNNLARHNAYGISGAYFAYGSGILQNYFPGVTFTRNYFAGASSSRYPSGSLVSGTAFESHFQGAAAGDYRLASSSPLRGAASDGTDLGADMQIISFVLRLGGTSAPVRAPAPPGSVRVVRGS